MAKFIETPLPIVYIDENRMVTILEGIDTSRSAEIYGIQMPVVVDYCIRTIFVNKINGADVNFFCNALEQYNISLARKPAIRTAVGCGVFYAREHVMCVSDLMALKSNLSLFNDTIATLRSNGIDAEEIHRGIYWALSDDAGNMRDSTQLDWCNEGLFHPYSVNMSGETQWFECVTDYADRRSRTTIEDDTPYYHIRSCYMLNDEPEIMKNQLALKVIADFCEAKRNYSLMHSGIFINPDWD